ncbi:MAG: LysM peptidoglycan-binding domain-containing protein [Bacteroidales bacterium]|nr:LysM peptidoglycan-binding domain-containing protein [Bacteroidales bacterium]
MKPIFFILSYIFLITGSILLAQEPIKIENKATKIEIINGKKYYIHTVLKGQTLYSIAKAYNISVDEIIKENPDAKKSLALEQKLKIPVIGNNKQIVTEKSYTKAPPVTSVKKDSFIYHTVKPKETLYGISKRYNVTVDEIKAVNLDADMNIQPGQIIKIPFHPNDNQETKRSFFRNIFKKEPKPTIIQDTNSLVKNKDTTTFNIQHSTFNIQHSTQPCKEIYSSERFNIALFIPLYLEEIENIITEDKHNELKAQASYRSLAMIQFYEGAMLAFDSLKNLGLNARFFVYDMPNDSNSLKNILKKPEFDIMNIIICPQYKKILSPLLNFVKNNNTKLITSSSFSPIFLNNYTNIYETQPSMQLQISGLINFVFNKYIKDNILVLFQSNNANEKKKFELFKNLIHDTLTNKYKAFDISNNGLSQLMQNLSGDKNNIIICFIDGELTVSNTFRILNNSSASKNLILFGNQNWERYQSVELDYFNKFNVHFCNNNFIDYSDNDVKQFIKTFRQTYKTEPNINAYQGFDICFFFSSALYKYGLNFSNCLNLINPPLLTGSFKFKKTEKNCFYNTYISIYKYSDYKLQNADK